jgi:hypothetical protein
VIVNPDWARHQEPKRRFKMVIIGSLSYPPESANEVVKRFVTEQPLPSYITAKGPYVSSELGCGIKSITIYEFDQSRASEAIQEMYTRYAKFIGVPGLTYSVNIWLEAMEALKMIGLA